jgi:hypothetical protein
MYFALTYLDPPACGERMLLLPNFQRSLASSLRSEFLHFRSGCHPFFQRECKGKGRIISTQIFVPKNSGLLV